jgi:hypothetical protein
MANVFDQFDAPPAAPASGNIFDQFDARPTASFEERFSNAPMASSAQDETALDDLQTGLRRKADEQLVGTSSANPALAALYRAGNTIGLNLPRNAAAAIATGAGKLGVPGYPERSFSQNYELSKEQEEALARQNPKSAMAGTAAGVVGSLGLPGFQAAKGAGLAGRAAANAATGAVYGAAGEFADSKSLGEAAKAGAIGGALGGVLTPAAEGLGKVIGHWRQSNVPYLDPKTGAFTPEAEKALHTAGIDLKQVPDDILKAFQEKGPGEDVIRDVVAKREGINLTRGQAEQNFPLQQREYAMAQSGEAFGKGGEAMREGLERQRGEVDAARERIGRQVAGGEDRVSAPQDAAEIIAERGRGIAETAAQGEARATQEATRALESIRGRDPLDTLDAAETTRQAVRGRAADAKRGVTQAYSDAFDREGVMAPEFFTGGAKPELPGGERALPGPGTSPGARAISLDTEPAATFTAPLSQRITEGLANRPEPIIIDKTLTPRASAMLSDLERVTEMKLGRTGQPVEGQDVAGINLRGLDQARKILTEHLYGGGAAATSPTDRRAMRGVIDAFDDQLEHGVASAHFSGDPGALDALRGARDQFAAFKRTFGPSRQGDQAGTALRAIVERDATPEQVASYLYGTSGLDRSGRGAELGGRLREMLGAESPEFRAIQQGLISRVLGDGAASHEAINTRVQTALTGDSRRLLYSVLNDGQVAGLRAFQQASQRARTMREEVPTWVTQLGKTEFSPNTVAANLWGKSTVGGNATSAAYANAIRRTFGETSPEWQAVRQAVWQKLVENPASGRDNFGAQKTASNIGKFLEDAGRPLANSLYSAEERAAMKSFQRTMETLIPMKVAGVGASPNSATAPTFLAANAERLKKHSGKIAALLGGITGLATHGPWGSLVGSTMGAGIEKGAEGLAHKLQQRAYRQEATRSLAGAARKIRRNTTPPIHPAHLARAAGVAAAQDWQPGP